MAHVKRLDSGRWQARYRDPEHHEHARNFRTRAAAQSWLDSVTAALVRGDYADPRSGRLVLGQLAETWYETTQTLKPSTRLAYRSLLDRRVLPRWGDVELRGVTTSAVATWVAGTAAERSASTTRKALSVLCQVLDLAVADRRLAANPAAGVGQPRLPMVEQRFLTSAELDRLADGMPSERDRVLALLLGWVGLRFGEAAGLTPSDVDVLRRRIRIERAVSEVRGRVLVGSPKTHAARTIALPAFLAEEIAAYLVTRDAGAPLFSSSARSFLRVTGWKRRIFDCAARAAGLVPPALRVHDLRHTAAALAIASGANVKTVQRQLGHRSATLTLDRYGHLFPDELDTLSNALDGLRVSRAADSLRTVPIATAVVALSHGG